MMAGGTGGVQIAAENLVEKQVPAEFYLRSTGCSIIMEVSIAEWPERRLGREGAAAKNGDDGGKNA